VKYRMIDVQNVVVAEKHYPDIAQILEAEGWGPARANTAHGKVSLYLTPMEARESFQILKEIAPWVIDGDVESNIILEQETTPVTWLHLVYEQGHATEHVTPAHQWKVD